MLLSQTLATLLRLVLVAAYAVYAVYAVYAAAIARQARACHLSRAICKHRQASSVVVVDVVAIASNSALLRRDWLHQSLVYQALWLA